MLTSTPRIVGGGGSISTPISPANGGTGTTTVFTQGSIVFAGAAGVYTQDNANFNWNDTTQVETIGSSSTVIGALNLAQLTPATVTNNYSSTQLQLMGTYWTGAVTANDNWQIQNILAASGANPTSTLTIGHTGSSGATLVQVNSALTATGTVTGLNLTTSGTVTASFLAVTNAGANISLGANTLLASNNAIFQFAGSTNNNWRVAVASSNTQNVPVNSNYSQFLVGSNAVSYVAGSATIGFVANAVVNPLGAFTLNGNTVTNTASLYVGAPSVSGTNNYSLFVNGPLAAQAYALTKATAYTILSTDSLTYFDNIGAGSQVVLTLPTTARGLIYTASVQNAVGIQIKVAAGSTIRVGGSASSSGGTATATGVGSVLTIVAISSTEWYATSQVGTWTLA